MNTELKRLKSKDDEYKKLNESSTEEDSDIIIVSNSNIEKTTYNSIKFKYRKNNRRRRR